MFFANTIIKIIKCVLSFSFCCLIVVLIFVKIIMNFVDRRHITTNDLIL